MPAVIFDYDGLMIDSERVLAECVVEIVTGRGGRLTLDDIAHLFGTTSQILNVSASSLAGVIRL